MTVKVKLSDYFQNYGGSGSLITRDSSTGVIYVLHWYQARCTFGSPPPQYKYLNQGVQSINALRNLNALTEVISSSISASKTLVLGNKNYSRGGALFKY